MCNSSDNVVGVSQTFVHTIERTLALQQVHKFGLAAFLDQLVGFSQSKGDFPKRSVRILGDLAWPSLLDGLNQLFQGLDSFCKVAKALLIDLRFSSHPEDAPA
ncbi:hypothetical protein F2P81_006391 [Scophthalmus maximus]|uniref:Uncharacterized protein n=1 Tax=Scophthalmus maximus TaxID=52904 RepID=A0A6A4T336_SCOMX|nr:hypothetical protein F2P81_006391 [Scophthalmus maximus]